MTIGPDPAHLDDPLGAFCRHTHVAPSGAASGPLQLALRDIHAVTQHSATAPSQYESAGRMLVGLPPLQSRILL